MVYIVLVWILYQLSAPGWTYLLLLISAAITAAEAFVNSKQ